MRRSLAAEIMSKLVKATDLSAFKRCDRLVYLNHNGDPALRVPSSAYQKWVQDQGIAFEQQVVSTFDIFEPEYPIADFEQGFALTLDYMRQGVAYIFQGVLLVDGLIGLPDLMQRVDDPSNFGSYHYRPVDVKSATKARIGHELQVMFYATLLESIQGVRPEGSLFLRTPSSEAESAGLFTEMPVEYDAEIFDEVLAQVRALAAGEEPPPFYSSTCKGCHWHDVCVPELEASEDVSLLSGIRRSVWQQLRAQGIRTYHDMAKLSPGELVVYKGVGKITAEKMINQAQALSTGQPVVFAPVDLPEPTDLEIFFDVESVPSEDCFYLMGLLVRRGDDLTFEYDLAEHPGEQAAMWEQFLQHIDRIGGWVYHYGVYERTAINCLMSRFGEDPRALDLLDRLVDLQKVINESVTLPLKGYSLKDVAPWLGFEWSGVTQHADDSMLEYFHWLETGDRTHIDNILVYNKDDVEATRVVRDWLLTLSGGEK
ncbi:MAG: TM0106 family RecB-like putative nuclease [Anaerolineae bacterium]|nr:TM0106 family RecB-like putative nuclease [Anaerolineae bacterium]